jgi:hypothetical protein
MTDGPGSVSTLILVVVRSIEEGRGELEGDCEKDVDKVESESTADARAATMRVRTVEVHMDA